MILVGGLHNNAEIFPTLALAHALSGYGARSLTLVSPFTCYSTAERSVMAGEVVSFKVLARMISNIPGAQAGNCVVFCDLHKEGEERYIEGDLRVSHLYLDRPIVEAIQEVGGDHYKLVSPDLGRAKWIRSHARQLGVGSALVDKDRSANEVHAEVLYGDVSGWDVVLYDDMCRSGSSLREAARICRDHGAGKIYIVVSHGELNGNALQELRNSGLFAGLVTTNSHPKAVELARSGDFAGFLSVKSIAGMIAGHLRGDSGNR